MDYNKKSLHWSKETQSNPQNYTRKDLTLQPNRPPSPVMLMKFQLSLDGNAPLPSMFHNLSNQHPTLNLTLQLLR